MFSCGVNLSCDLHMLCKTPHWWSGPGNKSHQSEAGVFIIQSKASVNRLFYSTLYDLIYMNLHTKYLDIEKLRQETQLEIPGHCKTQVNQAI